MDDLKLLKERHDLRLIVEADLGPAHCRGGKALLWRCPFHNEHKGYSLAVWENGWRCFGACGTQGDVLDWLQRYRGLSFTEACEYLGTAPMSVQTRPVHRQARTTAPFAREAEPPKAEWQAEAKAIVDGAESVLWSPESGRALQYLKQRGLTEETILQARLGYIPGRPWEWLRIGQLT